MLRDLPLVIPFQNENSYSSFHLYAVRLISRGEKNSQNNFFNAMRNAGIGVQKHYIPVHTQPYYNMFGFASGDFPEAEKFYKEAVSLPLFHLMTDAEQDHVVDNLRRFLL